MVSLEIETYRVFLISQDKSKFKGRQATIHLFLKDTDAKAFLFFYVGAELPSQNKMSGSNYKTYWKMSQFADVVDILRNEKPLWFYFGEKTKVANIQTTQEPVGEEESS
ncbi:MAG: hypothetical protein HWN65_17815 [Candidatus Helarchaeota archaeon]|nr:hypothetical protein [Candidatus Helarchaeota archaeon]